MAKKTVEKKTKVPSAKEVVEADRVAEEVTHPSVEAKEVKEAPEAPVEKEAPKSKEQRTAEIYAEAMMEKMMPAFLAVARNAGGTQGAKEGTEAAEARIKRWQICNDCRQKGPKAPPCKGEHTKMVVYPTLHPRFGPWFPGSIINGVRYLSTHRREKILVPSACVSQITKQIADFEENEMATLLGRSAEHNSGELAENGTGKQHTANQAWR